MKTLTTKDLEVLGWVIFGTNLHQLQKLIILQIIEVCFNFTITTSGMFESAKWKSYIINSTRYCAVGVMHGFGSWFEVEFGSIPDGHDYSPMTLSTAPWKPYVRSRVHAQLNLGSILKLHALSYFDQSKLYSMLIEARVHAQFGLYSEITCLNYFFYESKLYIAC
jgi:hypothetical protein